MKIAFLFLLFAGPVFAQDWFTDFEKAKDTAKKENKYILLNFSGSDWCGPCIKMKKEVFESSEFQVVADERLVLVRADFPRSKKNQLSKELTKSNEALAEKYNRDGNFPLTLLLDSDGKLMKTWDGYVFASHEKFMVELKTALASK